MLVLFGPDRCGKTTVAEKVVNGLGYMYMHHTVPPYDPFAYFTQFLVCASRNVVVDRNHLCEYAYGHTYRGQSGITDHNFKLLTAAYYAHYPVFVRMTDEKESVRSRWGEEEPFDFEKFDELQRHYDEVLKKYRIPHLVRSLNEFQLADSQHRGLPRGQSPQNIIGSVYLADIHIAYRDETVCIKNDNKSIPFVGNTRQSRGLVESIFENFDYDRFTIENYSGIKPGNIVIESKKGSKDAVTLPFNDTKNILDTIQRMLNEN